MQTQPPKKEFDIYGIDSVPPILGTNYIATGIPIIDSHLNGGLRRCELGTILAPWRGGKTSILTIIGANAFMIGQTILHVIYEDYVWDVKELYNNIFRDNQYQLDGVNRKFLLVDGVSEPPTLMDLETIANDCKPDIIIIDYAELIPGEFNIRDIGKRHLLRQNFIDLRRLAGKTNSAVWTAHQASIVSTIDRKPILRLTPDRVSECRSIGATVDVLLGFALNDPFDQFVYTTIMKAKHRKPIYPDFFKLAVDFSIPTVWSI